MTNGVNDWDRKLSICTGEFDMGVVEHKIKPAWLIKRQGMLAPTVLFLFPMRANLTSSF